MLARLASEYLQDRQGKRQAEKKASKRARKSQWYGIKAQHPERSICRLKENKEIERSMSGAGVVKGQSKITLRPPCPEWHTA
ncbi:UNVERIFIED_ORG: hypothetical protein ABRZ91_002391 [Heyndrickxia coagulans]